MYQIIDNTNAVIASAADKHEIDSAWDVLTKPDEELARLYTDETYRKTLITKYKKTMMEPIRLVQVWKTFVHEPGNELVGKNFDEAKTSCPAPYFLFPDRIDGNAMIRTADLNMNRISVHVENGIITKVNGAG